MNSIRCYQGSALKQRIVTVTYQASLHKRQISRRRRRGREWEKEEVRSNCKEGAWWRRWLCSYLRIKVTVKFLAGLWNFIIKFSNLLLSKETIIIGQVATHILWLGQTIKKAIDGPRLHHQLLPPWIEYEAGFKEVIFFFLLTVCRSFYSR